MPRKVNTIIADSDQGSIVNSICGEFFGNDGVEGHDRERLQNKLMSGLQLNKYIFVCKAEKAKVIYEVIDDGGNHTKELLTNLCFLYVRTH